MTSSPTESTGARSRAALVDNVGTWIERRARTERDRLALLDQRCSLTYQELALRSIRLAAALEAAGINRGDRVAAILKNRAEFVELFFATARTGAIFVPLNYRLAADEVAYALSDTTPSLLFVQTETASAAAESGFGARTICVDTDSRWQSWRDGPIDQKAVHVGSDDLLTIVYTTGSTGNPKGAVLTHGNAAASALNYLVDWDLRRDDVTFVMNPIFHVVFYILTLPLLLKGGTVLLREDFDPEVALSLVEEHRVTVWFGIPTSWQAIVESPSFPGTDLSSLRFVASGGAACPTPVIDALHRRGLTYRQGYGLTESCASGSSLALEDGHAVAGSVGRPFFNLEARIVNEAGEDVACGVDGELLLRGRPIFREYWRRPDETAAAFDDDWFRTGDIARIDADEYIWIVDRKKDIIISGGENISAAEVEQVILTHPSIREVAVVGAPHDHWGEVPVAYVSLRPDMTLAPGELIDHCRAQIARYKCPARAIVLEELPKTSNGKIDKKRLRMSAEEGSPVASHSAVGPAQNDPVDYLATTVSPTTDESNEEG